MVELIDSSYKVMDKDGVESAVKFMLENRDNPEQILNHKGWIQNSEKIKDEIESQLSKEITKNGNCLIVDMNTPFNIISTITRRLYRNNPDKISIVVNRGFSGDKDQLYIRGKNIQNLIGVARENGYSAGGKKDVVGVVLPKKDTNDFIITIKENV